MPNRTELNAERTDPQGHGRPSGGFYPPGTVSPIILERFLRRLRREFRFYALRGDGSVPVAIIGSNESAGNSYHLTRCGNVCGHPVEGVEVDIIAITEGPISEWSPQLRLPAGAIGEIVVHGPMVTQQYFRRPDLTSLAKIFDPVTGRQRHRMGDVGYFDAQGRLWFCGRKSHRVLTPHGTLFTEPVEGVFNTHPAVFRTALVGVSRTGKNEPVLCVEHEKTPSATGIRTISNAQLTNELLEIGGKFEHTRSINTILFHPSFPVDIRHNSKIFREKLATWAGTAANE